MMHSCMRDHSCGRNSSVRQIADVELSVDSCCWEGARYLQSLEEQTHVAKKNAQTCWNLELRGYVGCRVARYKEGRTSRVFQAQLAA